MNRGRFQFLAVYDPLLGPGPNSFLEPSAQVHFAVVRRNIANLARTERSLQMPAGSHIGLVGLFSADRWLGIVLQKIVHPGLELKLISLSGRSQESCRLWPEAARAVYA